MFNYRKTYTYKSKSLDHSIVKYYVHKMKHSKLFNRLKNIPTFWKLF